MWVGLDESTAPVRPPARGGRPPFIRPCVPQSFGALLLRLGAMIRPTASGRFLRHLHSSYCTTTRRVALCRDARSVRPSPLKAPASSWFDNGRSDRASLQKSYPCVPTAGYTSRFDGDGRTARLPIFWVQSKGHNKRKARLMRSCGPVRRAFLFVAYIYEETT